MVLPGFYYHFMKFNYIFRKNSQGATTQHDEKSTQPDEISCTTGTAKYGNARNGMFFYAWFEAMHTRIDSVICDKNEACCLAVIENVISEIRRIEKLADRFQSDSEISRLNQLASLHAITVSDEMFAIISECINYFHQTAGAFDITIQSFNNYRKGIHDLELNSTSKSVFFRNPNVQLDLCGFIKGYALDRIIALFYEEGIANALINMGNSSIAALGDHPNGKGWKITHPSEPTQSITLFNECLSSSGNSANHLHIFDPSTGQPAACGSIQTIITPTATEGEVKATAMCARK
jgi:thiamine biosynthesis lipoprotein